ncbi:MAG: hypothetical protein FP825_02815 [Hyphomonas sp.]|uniref:hypothetical protein n=1 Tax=Hyphomonas sp. TaxID=87 RepID=UPI0017AA37BA|nr:hypothetical protein [Hyphomonas sp.]MBU3921420.1 hypothetical protein [Alphaproteobacteria bacterium]MBA3067397.1 hypothetical protein [Hyphomonas sp.]MBU4061052.1 hypothetical protein [Alphaproteobacteria bacterium]MBU4165908.1 hypothetical protein [Alphaproteobacteria bacterium]MBU4569324.1 hypothetical protein [Alphaproteobacteria bacterium]
MFLSCKPNPHDGGRMTRALVFEKTPGTHFAIDAETLHRQPELLKPFGRWLDVRLRVLDTLAYLVCLLGVLAVRPVGWWTAGAGLLICVLTLAANRKTAGRLARTATERSTENFRQLHEMGCLWLVKD